jgi:hypothetical protein
MSLVQVESMLGRGKYGGEPKIPPDQMAKVQEAKVGQWASWPSDSGTLFIGLTDIGPDPKVAAVVFVFADKSRPTTVKAGKAGATVAVNVPAAPAGQGDSARPEITLDPTGGTDKVTLENYEKVKKGMTEAEVLEILGPPGAISGNNPNNNGRPGGQPNANNPGLPGNGPGQGGAGFGPGFPGAGGPGGSPLFPPGSFPGQAGPMPPGAAGRPGAAPAGGQPAAGTAPPDVRNFLWKYGDLVVGVVFLNGKAEDKRVITSEKVTQANFAKVENGMTTDKVFEILGPSFGSGPGEAILPRVRAKNPLAVSWQSKEGVMYVVFAEGKVIGKKMVGSKGRGR